MTNFADGLKTPSGQEITTDQLVTSINDKTNFKPDTATSEDKATVTGWDSPDIANTVNIFGVSTSQTITYTPTKNGYFYCTLVVTGGSDGLLNVSPSCCHVGRFSGGSYASSFQSEFSTFARVVKGIEYTITTTRIVANEARADVYFIPCKGEV